MESKQLSPEEHKNKDKGEGYGRFYKHEVESAFNDIKRAEEHKSDKELMHHVRKHAGKQNTAHKRAIRSIQDIRDTYKHKYPEGSKKEEAMESREEAEMEGDI